MVPGHSAESWRKSALPELTELDGVTLGVGVVAGEVGSVAPGEERGVLDLAGVALPVAVDDALPLAFAVLLGSVLALGGALGVLLGAVVVTGGVASTAAHAVSRAERVETIAFASVRLVAVIEASTLDCCVVGSPSTVTGSEL